MKHFRKELWFEINKRRDFINITQQVRECLHESGIREGLLLCNAMHITASVFINDDESGLHQDFEEWLEGLAPEKPYSRYRHNGFEDNADAHLKRSLMGREVVVAISDGKLDFGPAGHATLFGYGHISTGDLFPLDDARRQIHGAGRLFPGRLRLSGP